MKYFFAFIFILMISSSCVDDEFGNVVGTWGYNSESFEDVPIDRPPPIGGGPGTCEVPGCISFHNDLTGIQLIDTDCDNDIFDPIDYSFEYHIKEGLITITYIEEAPVDKNDFSGVNSFLVSDNSLTLTNEAGESLVLYEE